MSKSKCKINYVNNSSLNAEFRLYNGWFPHMESESVSAGEKGTSNLENPGFRCVMIWWDDKSYIGQNHTFDAPYEYTITLHDDFTMTIDVTMD